MPLLDRGQLTQLFRKPTEVCHQCDAIVSQNYCRTCDEYFLDGHAWACVDGRHLGCRRYDPPDPHTDGTVSVEAVRAAVRAQSQPEWSMEHGGYGRSRVVLPDGRTFARNEPVPDPPRPSVAAAPSPDDFDPDAIVC